MSLAPSGGGGVGDAQLVAGTGGAEGAPNGDRDSVDDVIERLLSVRGAFVGCWMPKVLCLVFRVREYSDAFLVSFCACLVCLVFLWYRDGRSAPKKDKFEKAMMMKDERTSAL